MPEMGKGMNKGQRQPLGNDNCNTARSSRGQRQATKETENGLPARGCDRCVDIELKPVDFCIEQPQTRRARTKQKPGLFDTADRSLIIARYFIPVLARLEFLAQISSQSVHIYATSRLPCLRSFCSIC